MLNSYYTEYMTKIRLYIFLLDKNMKGFVDVANSLSKHNPKFFPNALCASVSECVYPFFSGFTLA